MSFYCVRWYPDGGEEIVIILRLKLTVGGLTPHNIVLNRLYASTDSHFFYFKGRRPNCANQRIKGKAVLDSLRVVNRIECDYAICGGCVDFLVGEE